MNTIKAIQLLVERLSGEEPNPVLTNVDALKQLYEARGGSEDISDVSLIPDIIEKIAENEGTDGIRWYAVTINYQNQVEGCEVKFCGYKRQIHQTGFTYSSGPVPIGGVTLYIPVYLGVANLALFPTVADGYELTYETTEAEEKAENRFTVTAPIATIKCVFSPV